MKNVFRIAAFWLLTWVAVRVAWYICNCFVSGNELLTLPRGLKDYKNTVNEAFIGDVFGMERGGGEKLDRLTDRLKSALGGTASLDVTCLAFLCYKNGYCDTQRNILMALWLEDVIEEQASFCHFECVGHIYSEIALTLNDAYSKSNRAKPLFTLFDFSVWHLGSLLLWCILNALPVCLVVHLIRHASRALTRKKERMSLE